MATVKVFEACVSGLKKEKIPFPLNITSVKNYKVKQIHSTEWSEM